MARYVKIASVQFRSRHLRGRPGARQAVLDELDEAFETMAGRGIELAVFCEGVEAVAQEPGDAESLDAPGPIVEAYQRFAAAERCTVAGSVKLAEGGEVHNSVVFVGPGGEVLGRYHKTFLTRRERAAGLAPGRGAVAVETPAGRLAGAICFDLNFTDLCEQTAAMQPDIIVFPSMYHGGLMQGYWAYRCRAFFVAALPFMGGGVLDPFGEPTALTHCYTWLATARVNLDRVMVHLDHNRDKFVDMERTYGDRVRIHVPANIGPALIYSEDDQLTAVEMARKWELELMDDYLAEAHAAGGIHQPVGE